MGGHEYLYFRKTGENTMSYNQLSVNFKDIEEQVKKFKLLPKSAEFEINNYMWGEASKILEKEVYKRMPLSKYEHFTKGAPKTHAKQSDSLEKIRYDLGIKIQTKIRPKSKDFGYLIFSDEGRGIRQRKKGKQEFFNKALESQSTIITNGLTDHLNKKIEEVL